MSGTVRPRRPLVPLSMSPPGPGVVCRRTVQSHVDSSISSAPHAGHFADAGCGRTGEHDHVSLAGVPAMRTGNQRGRLIDADSKT
jgi:hypothetical protein